MVLQRYLFSRRRLQNVAQHGVGKTHLKQDGVRSGIIGKMPRLQISICLRKIPCNCSRCSVGHLPLAVQVTTQPITQIGLYTDNNDQAGLIINCPNGVF